MECCDGELDSEWKINPNNCISFFSFRLLLLEQLLTYDPAYKNYAINDTYRENTWAHKKNEHQKSDQSEKTWEKFPDIGLMMENLGAARACGHFTDHGMNIKLHFESIQQTTNKNTCEVCGKKNILEMQYMQ